MSVTDGSGSIRGLLRSRPQRSIIGASSGINDGSKVAGEEDAAHALGKHRTATALLVRIREILSERNRKCFPPPYVILAQ